MRYRAARLHKPKIRNHGILFEHNARKFSWYPKKRIKNQTRLRRVKSSDFKNTKINIMLPTVLNGQILCPENAYKYTFIMDTYKILSRDAFSTVTGGLDIW